MVDGSVSRLLKNDEVYDMLREDDHQPGHTMKMVTEGSMYHSTERSRQLH